MWKRPIAFGIEAPPLYAATFALVLLLLIRATGDWGRRERVSVVVAVVAAATAVAFGIGEFMVRFTVSGEQYRRFGFDERRIGVGDLLYRIPNLTLALVALIIGVSLLRRKAVVR
jgi:hypothetical protein